MPKLIPMMHSDGTTLKGYLFFCPGCKKNHHFITDVNEKVHWGFNGNVDSPTVSPSIRVEYNWEGMEHNRICHFFIIEGQIRYCTDSNHSLAGQSVELPDVETGV